MLNLLSNALKFTPAGWGQSKIAARGDGRDGGLTFTVKGYRQSASPVADFREDSSKPLRAKSNRR